jgi:Uma2 family endonuclease
MMTLTAPAPDLRLPDTLTTVDEFEAWQHETAPNGQYEFVRGQLILKPAMKQNELDLVDFLIRQFIQTPQFQQRHVLLPEFDSYVDDTRKRIPDLTYFTVEQRQAIRRGERVNTLFAIEILSDSESHQDVVDKIEDYFDGGARLVWYIMPQNRRVEAYLSPVELIVYRGTDTITADPVLPDYQFVVADLFA